MLMTCRLRLVRRRPRPLGHNSAAAHGGAPWSGSGHCIDGWYGDGGGVACGVGMKFGMN